MNIRQKENKFNNENKKHVLSAKKSRRLLRHQTRSLTPGPDEMFTPSPEIVPPSPSPEMKAKTALNNPVKIKNDKMTSNVNVKKENIHKEKDKLDQITTTPVKKTK